MSEIDYLMSECGIEREHAKHVLRTLRYDTPVRVPLTRFSYADVDKVIELSGNSAVCGCAFCKGSKREDVQHLKLFAPGGAEFFMQIASRERQIIITEKL